LALTLFPDIASLVSFIVFNCGNLSNENVCVMSHIVHWQLDICGAAMLSCCLSVHERCNRQRVSLSC